MKSILLFVGLLLWSGAALLAQTAYLQLRISPTKAVVRLDTHRVLPNGLPIALEPGLHRLRLWAPDCELVDTTLQLTAGDTLRFRKFLHRSAEYLKYKADLQAYYHPRNTARIFTGLALTTVPLVTALNIRFAIKQKEQWTLFNEAEAKYQTAVYVNRVSRLRTEMLQARDTYKQLYRQRWIVNGVGLGVIGLSSYISWRLRKRFKKGQKPIYHPETLLSHLHWESNWSQQKGFTTGFTLNFN